MRLFVAVPLSPAVKDMLARGMADLRGQGSGTFTRVENLHLTLAFLGETDRLAAAEAALDRCRLMTAFPITVGGLGRFGDLWWTGVREEGGRLASLAAAVQQALREEGFAIERRAWKPHITLVRRWQGGTPRVQLPPTSMEVRRFLLMESARREGRLTYTPLRQWEL